MDDFGDISELEASRIGGLSLQKAYFIESNWHIQMDRE